MVTAIGWGLSGYLSRLRDGITDRGDPLLSAWILAWDQHQLFREPLEIFQANIFHPFRDTLAYAESILAPAVLAAPARLFTDNPVAVQNVSIATAFLALGLASHFFFRWVTGHDVASTVGAILVSLSAARFGQVSNLQLLHTAGIPVLLYALWAYFEEPRRKTGALFAGALVFNVLCSLYVGLMAALAAAVFVAVSPLGFGVRRSASALRRLLPWAGIAAAAVLPFVLPYWRLAKEFGFVRSLEGQLGNWASHKYYIRPLTESFAGRLAGTYSLPRGHSLYLGLVTLALAGFALLSLRTSRGLRMTRKGFAPVLFVALAVVFFVVSLGGWRTLGDRRLLLPFYWLHQLPGFQGIRATVRFGMLVDFAVVGLAVLGLASLSGRLRKSVTPALTSLAAAGVGALALLERAPVPPIRPIESIEVNDEIPHVYRWLADDSPRTRILELPMAVGPGEREPWDVVPYKYVYFSTVHWRPMLNGTSGYLPPGYLALTERMGHFPSSEAIKDLQHLPIDRVVVHRNLYPLPIPATLFNAAPFRVLHDCADDLVVGIDSKTAGARHEPQPRIRTISESSSEKTVRVMLEWNEDLPALLYPPERYQITVSSRVPHDGGKKATRSEWLADPRVSRTYSVYAGPRATSVTLEVRTESGNRVSKAWNFL